MAIAAHRSPGGMSALSVVNLQLSYMVREIMKRSLRHGRSEQVQGRGVLLHFVFSKSQRFVQFFFESLQSNGQAWYGQLSKQNCEGCSKLEYACARDTGLWPIGCTKVRNEESPMCSEELQGSRIPAAADGRKNQWLAE